MPALKTPRHTPRRPTLRPSQIGEPVWELADMEWPRQGAWTEQDYLELDYNRLIEFDNGKLEFLPIPSFPHQRLARTLFLLLWAHIDARKPGEAFFAPIKVFTLKGKYREPDISFKLARNTKGQSDLFWKGADLVVEVVSPGKEARERDLVKKRREYARAGIAEYWIVDPKRKRVEVCVLQGRKYNVRVFKRGDTAESTLLAGFTVDVAALFAKPAEEE